MFLDKWLPAPAACPDHASTILIPQESIEQKIFLIRGCKVMLDRDLAVLYGVTTGKLPRAFTEHGILSLSSVLKSNRAVQVNIAIVRTFVRLGQILASHKSLAYKLELLERKIQKHDNEIRNIFDAIRQLIEPPSKPKRQVGFHAS